MATPAGNPKTKLPCKYGKNCYRKNPDHLQNFSHPGRDNDDEEVPLKKKKAHHKPVEATQRTLGAFFKKTSTEHAVSDSNSDSDNGSHSAERVKIEKESSPPQTKFTKKKDHFEKVKKSSKDGAESKPASGTEEEDEEEEVDSSPPPSPADEKENIHAKFLVKMPDDFYQFWEFCQSFASSDPQGVLIKSIKLKLVGPFDILSGRHKKLTKNKRGRRPNFLLHFRYFYDPPEFQTVLAATDKSNFHFGYFRDDPKEDPVFVASANPDAPSGKEKITPAGDNLFAAVHIHASKMMKSAAGAEKKEIENLLKKLENKASELGLTLSASTKRMKERQKKVVCATFHGAGMVVPVDENEIGYRPVPETPASLRTMLKKIADSTSKNERDQNFEELQDLITLVQFANDECDFGEGLELGLDLFCFGRKCFHPQITALMPLAYQFLNRNEFGEIIRAHLKNRRNLNESVDELEV